MQREQLGGTAMIAGAGLSLVVMAFHPTGHDVARDPARQGALNAAVHALAIASTPLALYGAWTLARRLSRTSALSELALAFYGIGAFAAIVAATASGFITPRWMQRALNLDGEARAAAEALLRCSVDVNQVFAKILVGASSLAIGMWSAEVVRTRTLRRSSGLVGVGVAGITLAALFSGRLRLDVHGFGAVVLAQSVWLVMVGIELCRSRAEPASAAG